MSHGNRGIALFHFGEGWDAHPNTGGKDFLRLIFLKALGLEPCAQSGKFVHNTPHKAKYNFAYIVYILIKLIIFILFGGDGQVH